MPLLLVHAGDQCGAAEPLRLRGLLVRLPRDGREDGHWGRHRRVGRGDDADGGGGSDGLATRTAVSFMGRIHSKRVVSESGQLGTKEKDNWAQKNFEN